MENGKAASGMSAFKDGRGDLILFFERLVAWLLDGKMPGAAFLLGRILAQFSSLTAAETAAMETYHVAEKSRLVKEAIDKERRSAKKDEMPTPAEVETVVQGWAAQLYTALKRWLSARGRELIVDVHVFTVDAGTIAVQRMIDYYGSGQKMARMGELVEVFQRPLAAPSLLKLLVVLRDYRDIIKASGVDAGAMLVTMVLKMLKAEAVLHNVAEKAAGAQLDLALLLKGLQDHHDIQGDVILVVKVPAFVAPVWTAKRPDYPKESTTSRGGKYDCWTCSKIFASPKDLHDHKTKDHPQENT
ncbi:hypothetical protein T484DRAFT_1806196 [Baffinella frigidus]|nr:hypothetical protein T484DRAFT_1806196 [Cryptophyta sp. CCMP2293]